MAKKILLTGGAGYIGSHTAVELLQAGYDVLILDSFANASRQVIRQIERLTNRAVTLVEADIRDRSALDQLFENHDIAGVVHFAGLKAVGESVCKPALYYDVNVSGSLQLMEAMAAADVRAFVFSSSATVYGDPARLPIDESMPYGPTNPYGRTKMMIEQAMADLAEVQAGAGYLALRYFNPVGAHRSGEIGEDPAGIPNNLFPYIAQVAVGRRAKLTIHGDDYDTPDGTGVRDYIHVVDLARGHVAAVAYAIEQAGFGFEAINLGTGRGYSVKEAVDAFAAASGRDIPCDIGPRRPGDIASCYADAQKAKDLLDWEAAYDLSHMCADGWRWQSTYPDGFASLNLVQINAGRDGR